MNIVHVITRLLNAGAEENTLATCKHQVQQGHNVFLLYGDESLDETLKLAESYGVSCSCIPDLTHPINPIKDMLAIRSLRQRYSDISADLIHTHQSKAGILGRLATVNTRYMVVHSVHIAPFVNVGYSKKILYVLAEKLCAKFTDAFINVSRGMLEANLNEKIGRPELHHVVYSGMDLERFRQGDKGKINLFNKKAQNFYSPKHSSDLKSMQNALIPSKENEDQNTLGESDFIVLVVGAFEKRKRQCQLIQAMTPVLKRNSHIFLVFCGDGIEFEFAKEISVLNMVDKQVIFVGHVMNPEDYMAAADIGAMVSEREGLPRVLVQFSAACTPVIATYLPGIEEVVKQNINGIIVDRDGLFEVAKNIEIVANNKYLYSKLRQGACGIDVSRWDIKNMGHNIDRVYHSISQ